MRHCPHSFSSRSVLFTCTTYNALALLFVWEKGKYLTQSYDKSPYNIIFITYVVGVSIWATSPLRLTVGLLSIYGSFCALVCVVTLPFWDFCWCRGWTESDIFLFLLHQQKIQKSKVSTTDVLMEHFWVVHYIFQLIKISTSRVEVSKMSKWSRY